MMSLEMVSLQEIQKAILGDSIALGTILEQYKPYIYKKSTKRLYDQYGHVYIGTDEALCRRIEAKVMLSILKFRILED